MPTSCKSYYDYFASLTTDMIADTASREIRTQLVGQKVAYAGTCEAVRVAPHSYAYETIISIKYDGNPSYNFASISPYAICCNLSVWSTILSHQFEVMTSDTDYHVLVGLQTNAQD